MAVDPTRSRELLSRAIELGNNGDPTDFNEWRETARVALGEQDETMIRSSDIRYSLMVFSSATPQSAWDKARRVGVQEAIAVLHAVQLELDATQPSAPAVDVNALHPWVAGMGASLWSGGHHRQAVEESARAVEVQLRRQARPRWRDWSASRLVTAAFSPRDPKPGDPRLRFTEFTQGTDNWTNAHACAMNFGRGLMMRVRNLYSHGHEPK